MHKFDKNKHLKKLSELLLALLLFISAEARSKDEIQIRIAMNKQTMAWNAGDMSRYMNTYWKSDSLMFISKNGVKYGWENILKNYQRFYSDKIAMGKLDFELISFKRLSECIIPLLGNGSLQEQQEIRKVYSHYFLRK